MEEKMKNEIQKVLDKFDGGKARLWYFTASHDRLVLRLSSSLKEITFIIFLGCNEISLPVLWNIQKPEIKKINEYEFQYSDSKAQILFGECQIQDDFEVNA